MLTTIRRPTSNPEGADVVDLLLSCHQRIRHFSTLAVRLGDGEEVPGAEAAAVAAAVYRYFHLADIVRELRQRREVPSP